MSITNEDLIKVLTHKIEIKQDKIMDKLTKKDIFKEFARIEQLREGTSLQLKELFRYNGKAPQEESFSRVEMIGEPEDYTFALTLVEGKPVFKGDILYTKLYIQVEIISAIGTCMYVREIKEDNLTTYTTDYLLWNKPKPTTFELNGKTLPLPEIRKFDDGVAYYLDSFNIKLDNYKKYRWLSHDDRDNVAKEIQLFLAKLLSGEIE